MSDSNTRTTAPRPPPRRKLPISRLVDGGTYYGPVVNGLAHGRGILKWPDGRVRYVGHLEKGIYHGKGVLFTKNGTRFEGWFDRGTPLPRGVIYYKCGAVCLASQVILDWKAAYYAIYQDMKPTTMRDYKLKDGGMYYGYCDGDAPQGKGIIKWPDGKVKYVGMMEKGVSQGKGVFYYQTNGVRYEGQFRGGKPVAPGVAYFAPKVRGVHKKVYTKTDPPPFIFRNRSYHVGPVDADGYPDGKGISKWPCGKIHFVGRYKRGKPNGYGVMYGLDGSRFAGTFQEGLAQGHGVNHFANGLVYRGNFKNGKRHGHGVLEYADGRRHEGAFERGQKNGFGVHTNPDGSRYEGMFVMNKLEGEFFCTFPDGSTYEGMLKNGEQHGLGTGKNPDGYRYEGWWKGGKYQGRGILFDDVEKKVIHDGLWEQGVAVRDNTPWKVPLNDECCICLGKFDMQQKIAATGCHHIFHWECLKEWLELNRDTCPKCRKRGLRSAYRNVSDS